MAGYKAWQKNFERHVNKGEKAIRILAPAPYKIKEERDKIDPVTQEIMLDRDGNPQKEEVEITIPAFREAVSPVPIEMEEIAGESKGYFDREARRIAVQENMSESQTLKTIYRVITKKCYIHQPCGFRNRF